MFNSLQVSNAIEQQVPSYLSNEYPNFINFFKDYYRFLETNGNALDILNGITDLIDIDTYTNKNLFFSHRRSFQQKKLPTGRMINIIAFKANP